MWKGVRAQVRGIAVASWTRKGGVEFGKPWLGCMLEPARRARGRVTSAIWWS